jgi:hypothetical protein
MCYFEFTREVMTNASDNALIEKTEAGNNANPVKFNLKCCITD